MSKIVSYLSLMLFFATILFQPFSAVAEKEQVETDKPTKTTSRTLSLSAASILENGLTPSAGEVSTDSLEKSVGTNFEKAQNLPPDPNRRWIMRQQDYTTRKSKPVERKPLKWTGTHQQETCRNYEGKLAQSFDKARFYSIQGDRCKTAQFATEFLDFAEWSGSACPKEFMQYYGYNVAVVRNMYLLKVLGAEHCLGVKVAPEITEKKAISSTKDDHSQYKGTSN